MLGYSLTTRGKHALVIKQRLIVKTPSAWDEHDLPWSIQIQRVFHRRHCLKVSLRRHHALHSSDTSCSCVRNCYTGCTVWHLAGLRLIHTIPDTTCLPT